MASQTFNRWNQSRLAKNRSAQRQEQELAKELFVGAMSCASAKMRNLLHHGRTIHRVTSDKTRIEHNESAVALIAGVPCDMDFVAIGQRRQAYRSKIGTYSITSSARATNICEKLIPRAFAVLKFMAS